MLCAPTLTDVLPTIRSRTRNLLLRTPSTAAVSALLQREGASEHQAEFAARASQGHIGRARYLVNSDTARNLRSDAVKLAVTISDIASAFNAAGKLVDAAKEQATLDAEEKNERELKALKEAWGQQGSKLSTGGSKAVKDLEKEQKSRQTRMAVSYTHLTLPTTSRV